MIRMKDVARYANPDPAEITKMKQAHRLIAEMSYEHTPLERGYTDKRLRIDIGTNEIQIFDIPADVK